MFGGFGGRDDNKRGGGSSELLAMAILAPLAATHDPVVDFAHPRISGRCERGETHARSAVDLANALRKLESANERMPLIDATPATAHLFIVNPLSAVGMTGYSRPIRRSKSVFAGSNR